MNSNITFSWNDWLIVIPARLGSTRLPEKPLTDLGGQPLIARVYERLAPLAEKGAKIIVGTDSAKVLAACQQAGVPCEMTAAHHTSGTDRVYEIATRVQRPFVLNVQGDEPFIDRTELEALGRTVASATEPVMGTLVTWNQSAKSFHDPNCVKVVRSDTRAMYFSRAPVPFDRDGAFRGFWQHLGVYAFAYPCLERFCQLPQAKLEQTESLEQLRALAADIPILVAESTNPGFGIDTPEDLEKARARY